MKRIPNDEAYEAEPLKGAFGPFSLRDFQKPKDGVIIGGYSYHQSTSNPSKVGILVRPPAFLGPRGYVQGMIGCSCCERSSKRRPQHKACRRRMHCDGPAS